ncbi:purine-nucleoside phosphorylase [Patescibacteria group bacterium]|nr:purine-nucleoside phosphorylase [Patescibacteria group bacterium]MBU1613385.1 purine-nucleoside phosphorylase [Patescibacteria group bacterium]
MNGPIMTYAIRILSHFPHSLPPIAIVLGSGFNILVKLIQDAKMLNYKDIDINDFPVSTVEGHNGRFVVGTLNGVRVAVMDGRVHLYEGFTVDQVVFPLRMLIASGCKTVILTSAVGGISLKYEAGDLVLIRDHINLFTVANPMFGKRQSGVGGRFQDMNRVYDPELITIAQATARELDSAESNSPKINLKAGGILGFMPGPYFETPSEVEMLRRLGADVVGMSISEAIAAHHMGAKVLSIACVVNMAAGMENTEISHEGTIETMNEAAPYATRLIAEIVRNLPDRT